MEGTFPSQAQRAFAQYGIKVPRWEVQSLINTLVLWKGKSMAIVPVGMTVCGHAVRTVCQGASTHCTRKAGNGAETVEDHAWVYCFAINPGGRVACECGEALVALVRLATGALLRELMLPLCSPAASRFVRLMPGTSRAWTQDVEDEPQVHRRNLGTCWRACSRRMTRKRCIQRSKCELPQSRREGPCRSTHNLGAIGAFPIPLCLFVMA